MSRSIGLIAGNRSLPLMAARKAKDLGYRLAVAAIEGEADKELEKLADHIEYIKLGQMRAMINFFQRCKVEKLVMIGGISRESIILNYEPDELALDIMSSISDFHTDKILRAVCQRLESKSLKLYSVVELLPELLPPVGQLSQKGPDENMTADLKIAWHIAKELGRLDVGQCAVVSDRITLAVEAAEGTDETVKRGGALANKPVAVAKVVKPMQDLRLDPPVIGPETMKVMADSNVGALVIDCKSVLIVDMEESIKLANELGLVLIAWTDEMAQ